MNEADIMQGRLFLRLLSLLCVLCLMLSFPLGLSAMADIAGGKTGDLVWKLTDKGTLYISGTGEMGSYSAKDENVAWKPYNDRILSVVIESGVTRIGWCAFYGCKNLVKVSIPDTVTRIDLKAFMNCTSLDSLTIPASVTRIGDQAFDGCGGSSSIGTYLFQNKAEYDQYFSKTGVILHVKKGSFAEQYALEKNLPYDNGTVFFPGPRRLLQEKIEVVIAECIKPNMSEKEKAKVLHNWIIYHAFYGDNGKPGFGNLLLDGCGVCGDYADAYRLLLCRAGLANERVWGTAKGDSHFWNRVRIDGTWYHVDTTFDDPGTKKTPRSGNERSRYFMMTDKQIRKDHQWDTNNFTDGVYDPGR